MAFGAVCAPRAFEFRICNAERAIADLTARALRIAAALVGALAIHAKVRSCGTIFDGDTFGFRKRRANASAAMLIVSAFVILVAGVATKRIDAHALIRTIAVGLTRGGGDGATASIVADLILRTVAVSSAGAFRLAIT